MTDIKQTLYDSIALLKKSIRAKNKIRNKIVPSVYIGIQSAILIYIGYDFFQTEFKSNMAYFCVPIVFFITYFTSICNHYFINYKLKNKNTIFKNVFNAIYQKEYFLARGHNFTLVENYINDYIGKLNNEEILTLKDINYSHLKEIECTNFVPVVRNF
jgi:hypothetical protein